MEDLATKVRFSQGISSRINKEPDIEGTPYLSEEFKLGEVYTKDSILYKGPLRFNIFSNEIEFKSRGVVYWIAEPQKVVYAKIDKSTFIYSANDDKEKNGKNRVESDPNKKGGQRF